MRDITVQDIAAVILEARANPTSERVVAMRLALEEIDRQARERGEDVELSGQDHVDVSHAVAGGANWTDIADNHLEHEELTRRRNEPAEASWDNPDPALVDAFTAADQEDEDSETAGQTAAR